MNITFTRRAAMTMAVGALALGVSACGDDDDAAPDDFCQGVIDVETAVAAEDMEAVAPAFEALSAAAPEDIKASVDTAISEAQVFLADEEGEPTPEFETAYAELMTYVKEGCGFNEMSVVAQEYSFGGIDEEYDAGPIVITLENEGEEFHEIAIMRINDDVTQTAEELLALPQEEAESMVTQAAGGFAAPGSTGYAASDLQPGRYLAACFVPKGMTPEALEEMEASGAEPEGGPHFMEGMVAEFEVK